MNWNIDNMYEIAEFIIESHPSSVRFHDMKGYTPLHVALLYSTDKTDVRLIDLLLGTGPESTRQVLSCYRDYPIHLLCFRCSSGVVNFPATLKNLSEEKSLEILERLIRADPSSLKKSGMHNILPIHFPSDSLPFVKALIDSYPGALKIRADGKLPLHYACGSSPGINMKRSSIKVVQLLFDQYPESIESAPDIIRQFQFDTTWPGRDISADAELLSFLRKQRQYVRQSKIKGALHKKNTNGRVLLHRAMSSGASLGSVKLLLQGNPAALYIADNNGVMPVHLACQFGTVDIVKYLVEPYNGCLNTLDANNNSTLHYACLGGTCDVVSYLVQKQSTFVSTRNSDGEIPFQLLTESGADSQTTAFVEAAWLLLVAHPETVLQW